VEKDYSKSNGENMELQLSIESTENNSSSRKVWGFSGAELFSLFTLTVLGAVVVWSLTQIGQTTSPFKLLVTGFLCYYVPVNILNIVTACRKQHKRTTGLENIRQALAEEAARMESLTPEQRQVELPQALERLDAIAKKLSTVV
jgi:hypothetical protein